MSRLITTLCLLFVSAAAIAAPAKSYKITEDGKNYALFESEATLETIQGMTTKVTGTIVADPRNITASSVDVTVDLASLNTGIGKRDEHLRDNFLNTTQFPTATFKSIGVAKPAQAIEPNKPVEIYVKGEFTMHGVTKPMTVPVRVVYIPETELTKSSRGPGDWIHATTNFKVKLADFGVSVPEKLILKLADTVDVKLDVFAVARPVEPPAVK